MVGYSNPNIARGGQQALSAALIVGAFVGLLWVIEGFDWMLGGQLDMYGIRPWDLDGLVGIFTAPFLHAGFPHLMANSLPLLILGFLVAMRGIAKFFSASLIVMLASGAGVWLTSDPRSVTVGASGLVFGYFGYLLARGIFDRQPLDIAIGVVVFFLYNGMLFGVLPGQEGISWQGHLFGFVGGIAAAWMLRTARPR